MFIPTIFSLYIIIIDIYIIFWIISFLNSINNFGNTNIRRTKIRNNK